MLEIDAQGQAIVALAPRPATCGNCQSREACGSSLLGPGNDRRIRLANRIGARVGERVTIVVAAGTVLKASWFSYVVPGLLAIGGAVAGQSAGGDPEAVGGTLGGLTAGFVYLSWRSRFKGGDKSLVWLERETGATATGATCGAGAAPAISEKS